MSKGSHNKETVNLSDASRGIWLVKVPKYVSNKWEKAPSNIEVGKLKILKGPNTSARVTMALSESIMCMDTEDGNQQAIPKVHKLDISAVNNQSLGVFSQIPGEAGSPEKIALEGLIVQKLECHATITEDYMKMKLERIKNAHQPVRSVQRLDKVVQNYKPVATHSHLKEYTEKKKAEGKRSRDDKNDVLDMLFKAFEKHQYYNIKDLVLITKQPVGYLKEILKEVCIQNLKNPHKNMWELKPEYRHYEKEDVNAE